MCGKVPSKQGLHTWMVRWIDTMSLETGIKSQRCHLFLLPLPKLWESLDLLSAPVHMRDGFHFDFHWYLIIIKNHHWATYFTGTAYCSRPSHCPPLPVFVMPGIIFPIMKYEKKFLLRGGKEATKWEICLFPLCLRDIWARDYHPWVLLLPLVRPSIVYR